MSKRYRFNEYMRPYRYEHVERFLAAHGYPYVQIRKTSRGDFTFDGEICESWKENFVPVSRIRELTLGMWLEEFEYLIKVNEQYSND